MKAIKKTLIVFVTVLCVGFIFSDVTTVEAAKKPKARVTNVTAKVSGKKKIKVTFKKDKKAKKYKIKKYRVKLVKYTYTGTARGWVKKGTTYKTVNAYNGKRLKKSASVTFKNVTLDIDSAYKVQVASANSKGVVKTAYTSALQVGCFHEWLWETKSWQEKATEPTVVKVMEFKCDGCGNTGTLKWSSNHCTEYNSRRSDEYPTMVENFLDENPDVSADEFNAMGDVTGEMYEAMSQDEKAYFDNYRLDVFFRFTNYTINYLNKKYGYTTKLYTKEEYASYPMGYTWGCTQAGTTGNYIDYEVAPGEYITKTKTEATCKHCGDIRTEP